MRPYYCKPKDIANEKAVLAFLFNRLQSDSTRFNQGRNYEMRHVGGESYSPHDGEVYVNGKLFAIVEIKGRLGIANRYPDWQIGQAKVQRNIDLAAVKQVPLWLIFKWDDGMYMADVSTLDLSKTRISGRTDRGDDRDTEVMLILNPKSFRKI